MYVCVKIIQILGSGFDWRRRRKGCQETVSISGTIQRTNWFLRRAPWTNERHWKYENFATLVPLWHETIQTIIAEQYQKVRKIAEILIRDRPFRTSASFKDLLTPLQFADLLNGSFLRQSSYILKRSHNFFKNLFRSNGCGMCLMENSVHIPRNSFPILKKIF